MTERERMTGAQLYISRDKELEDMVARRKELLYRFNHARGEEEKTRMCYIEELFAHVGRDAYIEPDIYCDYGCHISVGDRFYANTGLIVLDQCDVTIGNDVLIGPRVSIFCAGHPVDARVRNRLLEYGKPVKIGDSVWIGGNTVINPGVTIGSDVVIGSGSVVTKDIPDHVIAVGNPCKVLRNITEEDRLYWEEQERYYDEDVRHPL